MIIITATLLDRMGNLLPENKTIDLTLDQWLEHVFRKFYLRRDVIYEWSKMERKKL